MELLLALIGIGGTIVGQALGLWGSRKERAEDRFAARREAHRQELRSAYAAFFAAYRTFLDAALQMSGIDQAIREIRAELYDSAMEKLNNPEHAEEYASTSVPRDLIARSRVALENYLSAGTSASTAGMSLLMLEEVAALRERLGALVRVPLSPPQSEEDYARFERDVKAREAAYEELEKLLDGAFSAVVWGTPKDGRTPALSDGDTLSLPGSP